MSCRYGAEVNEKCNLESVRSENARIRIANDVNTIFERKGDLRRSQKVCFDAVLGYFSLNYNS
jgi:hypothetical protein